MSPRPPSSRLLLALLAGAVSFPASLAHAQERPGATGGWSVDVGAGGLVSPEFRGASDYRVRAIPALNIRHGDDFAVTGLEAAYTPFRAGPWQAGAQARFRFGQDEDDDPVALRGLGGVSESVELGGFVSYGEGPFRVKASLAHDVLDGHGGQVATLGATYSGVIARGRAGPARLTLGPSVTWASARYNRAYYGVDARQALRSGLAPYQPGSGLESAGLSANLVAPLSPRLTLIGVAGYDRLLGDAADSPRLQRSGARDQGSVGVFLTYKLF